MGPGLLLLPPVPATSPSPLRPSPLHPQSSPFHPLSHHLHPSPLLRRSPTRTALISRSTLRSRHIRDCIRDPVTSPVPTIAGSARIRRWHWSFRDPISRARASRGARAAADVHDEVRNKDIRGVTNGPIQSFQAFLQQHSRFDPCSGARVQRAWDKGRTSCGGWASGSESPRWSCLPGGRLCGWYGQGRL